MKLFHCAIATLLLVLAPCAYADSTPTFNITQATILVGAGSDNVEFTMAGPGTKISGSGGLQCQEFWCDGQVFPSGSQVQVTFQSNGQIFIDGFGTVTLGGHGFDPNGVGFLSVWALNTSGGVLFSGASSFGVCQSAALSSPVSGQATQGDTTTTFTLRMPAGGEFCSNWSFNSDLGGYLYDGGKFVVAETGAPEPSTLGLIVMGLAGMGLGVIRRKHACGALRVRAYSPIGTILNFLGQYPVRQTPQRGHGGDCPRVIGRSPEQTVSAPLT